MVPQLQIIVSPASSESESGQQGPPTVSLSAPPTVPGLDGPAQGGPAQGGPAQGGPAQGGPALDGPALDGPGQGGPGQGGPTLPADHSPPVSDPDSEKDLINRAAERRVAAQTQTQTESIISPPADEPKDTPVPVEHHSPSESHSEPESPPLQQVPVGAPSSGQGATPPGQTTTPPTSGQGGDAS